MRIVSILIILSVTACQISRNKMELSLINQKKIQVPAVSGLEVFGDKLYMISDNTEGVSICDFSGKIIETISLDTDESSTQIIEKKNKSDYEGCTLISKDDEDYLLLIGSGSKKENRNKAKLICLTDGYKIKNYDLHEFYSFLRSKFEIKLDDFNIEALAYYDKKIYLFNRGTNEIFVLKRSSFFDFLKGEKEDLKLKRYKMQLDPINGVFAGVSGATITDDGLVIITASAERTGDWYNDGEIAGSSLGWFKLSEMQSEFKVKTEILKDGGKVLKSKIESVALHSIDQHKAKLFLVSDNDGAESELFEFELLVN